MMGTAPAYWHRHEAVLDINPNTYEFTLTAPGHHITGRLRSTGPRYRVDTLTRDVGTSDQLLVRSRDADVSSSIRTKADDLIRAIGLSQGAGIKGFEARMVRST